MSHREKDYAELRLAITSAKWKAAAAIHCANVLRPEAQCLLSLFNAMSYRVMLLPCIYSLSCLAVAQCHKF